MSAIWLVVVVWVVTALVAWHDWAVDRDARDAFYRKYPEYADGKHGPSLYWLYREDELK